MVLPIAELQNLLTQDLQLRVFSGLPSIEEANAVGSPAMPPTIPARPTVNHPIQACRLHRNAYVVESMRVCADFKYLTSP